MEASESEGLSGVSRTALLIAAVRAGEPRREDPWFEDPLASRFMAAAAARGGRERAGGDSEVSEQMRERWRSFARYIRVRTRFLDEYLMRAVQDGCRQIVILGAGLDARAFRLDLPEDTRVYELDLPGVFRFKEPVLEQAEARPRGERATVAVDLTEEWVEPLLRAGFDPGQPSAWTAEGLLIYLPQEAVDDLMRRLSDLAAPGSHLAFEHTSQDYLESFRKLTRAYGDGGFARLWKSALREHPAEWLAGFGWDADVATGAERAAGYGQALEGFGSTAWLVTAVRRDAAATP